MQITQIQGAAAVCKHSRRVGGTRSGEITPVTCERSAHSDFGYPGQLHTEQGGRGPVSPVALGDPGHYPGEDQAVRIQGTQASDLWVGGGVGVSALRTRVTPASKQGGGGSGLLSWNPGK